MFTTNIPLQLSFVLFNHVYTQIAKKKKKTTDTLFPSCSPVNAFNAVYIIYLMLNVLVKLQVE